VDRAHRQELKHDRFVEQVGHTVEYAAEHKQQVIRYTVIGLVVLALILGVTWYRRSQAAARQDALREAIRKQEAQVGPAQSPFLVSYPTEAEKQKAVEAAWNDLINRYGGSDEAMIAHFYMGVNAADKGNSQEAEKHFKVVADSGSDNYASQAKLSLASLYESMGKKAEAEKLLRSIVDDPTVLVSKEQATLALARLIAKDKPAEARKLLEPLRTERSAVSRAAITALSEIPAK
jgi:TolA-binding protein